MAIIKATPTPQSFGDGTAPLYITCDYSFHYGFGVAEPTTWHAFSPGPNSSLNVSTDYGTIWFKAKETVDIPVLISVGL